MNRYIMGVTFAAIIFVGSWLHGFQTGGQANEARHLAATAQLQQALFDAADRQSEMAMEIETYRAEQATRAGDAEDAARADPLADSRRPSADSLRRLAQRWSTQGAVP